MYEHRGHRPIARRHFISRLARHGMYASALIGASLFIGMAGYRWIVGYSWTDAYLNAAMLLGGMGPVGEMHGTAAKVFAGTYALYAGLVALSVTALLLAPIIHRVLHRFHCDCE